MKYIILYPTTPSKTNRKYKVFAEFYYLCSDYENIDYQSCVKLRHICQQNL